MLAPLMIPLALLAVTLLVFLADMAVSGDNRRGLGALTTMGLRPSVLSNLVFL